jgi:hypothetical protein
MNIKAFFVDALSAALELNIGTPDDVLRHVTPDVLAHSLPRPLWARLLTACIGAPRIDAQLVVETIGMANLCEHVPASILWGCIAELGARSLGQEVAAPPHALRTTASGRAILAPPPDISNAPTATGPAVAIGPSMSSPLPTPSASQPLADVLTELEQTDEARLRPRSPTAQRFRQSSTSVGARASLTSSRRPQAVAPPAPTTLPRPTGRRGTEVSTEPESPTSVEGDNWASREIAVDDSQLVEWQTDVGSASAITGDEDFSDLTRGRKR